MASLVQACPTQDLTINSRFDNSHFVFLISALPQQNKHKQAAAVPARIRIFKQSGASEQEIGKRLLMMRRTQKSATNKLSIWLILLTEYCLAPVRKQLLPDPWATVLYRGPITSSSRRSTCRSQLFCQNLLPLLTRYHATENNNPRHEKTRRSHDLSSWLSAAKTTPYPTKAAPINAQK